MIENFTDAEKIDYYKQMWESAELTLQFMRRSERTLRHELKVAEAAITRLEPVVRAALRFEDSLAEFDGDIQYCQERIDHLMDACEAYHKASVSVSSEETR